MKNNFQIFAAVLILCLFSITGFSQDNNDPAIFISDSLICECGKKYHEQYTRVFSYKVPFIPIVKIVKDTAGIPLGLSISTFVNYYNFEREYFIRYVRCGETGVFEISHDTIYDEHKHLPKDQVLKIAELVYDKNTMRCATVDYHIYKIQSDSMLFYDLSVFKVPFEYQLRNSKSFWNLWQQSNSKKNHSIDSIKQFYQGIINF